MFVTRIKEFNSPKHGITVRCDDIRLVKGESAYRLKLLDLFRVYFLLIIYGAFAFSIEAKKLILPNSTVLTALYFSYLPDLHKKLPPPDKRTSIAKDARRIVNQS